MLSTTPSISVIYENDELVVINKPIDVPMDGEGYPLTVERWANAYRSLREAVKEDTTEQLGTGTLLCDPAISIGHPSVTTIHCRKRVKFVHQLDFATSGVLCVAFSKEMAARLSHCFEMRTARKAYLAVVCGTLFSACSHGQKFETCFLEPQIRSRVRLIALDELPDATFIQECIAKLTMDCSRTVTDADNSASLLLETQLIEVNIPVGHDSSDAQNFRMAIDGRGARESLTYIHVLKHGFMSHPLTSMPVAVTKVALFPRTGRRHQLRVHCRALGFPIVGDVTYGFTDGLSPCEALRSQEHFCQESVKTCAWPRMMLHAWRLSLPVSVEPLRDEKERYLQKRKRRRETLGLDGATQHGQDFLEWTHFITEDPFSLADLDKEMDNG
ncbi:putative RNA pseudouridylate synthase [Trypanosoma vivax]|nr:putative RNA pseudouridylate synthase [Trypanosoma vivax]